MRRPSDDFPPCLSQNGLAALFKVAPPLHLCSLMLQSLQESG